uniref:Bestrophin homolog n=1 Tax=Steinernema glaseri TaxID=37863 RepID=A0A1I7YG11_9BILA
MIIDFLYHVARYLLHQFALLKSKVQRTLECGEEPQTEMDRSRLPIENRNESTELSYAHPVPFTDVFIRMEDIVLPFWTAMFMVVILTLMAHAWLFAVLIYIGMIKNPFRCKRSSVKKSDNAFVLPGGAEYADSRTSDLDPLLPAEFGDLLLLEEQNMESEYINNANYFLDNPEDDDDQAHIFPRGLWALN